MVIDISAIIAILLEEYALSKETNEPLLFKGNDFSQTDLKLVDYSKFLFE